MYLDKKKIIRNHENYCNKKGTKLFLIQLHHQQGLHKLNSTTMLTNNWFMSVNLRSLSKVNNIFLTTLILHYVNVVLRLLSKNLVRACVIYGSLSEELIRACTIIWVTEWRAHKCMHHIWGTGGKWKTGRNIFRKIFFLLQSAQFYTPPNLA